MSCLLPSMTVLKQWTTLTDAAAWASVDQGMLRALNCQIGDPVNDSLHVIALILDDLLQQAIDSAFSGTRPFSAIEKAQLLLSQIIDQGSDMEIEL